MLLLILKILLIYQKCLDILLDFLLLISLIASTLFDAVTISVSKTMPSIDRLLTQSLDHVLISTLTEYGFNTSNINELCIQDAAAICFGNQYVQL